MLTKFCIVKTTVFPGVMYSCECWTIKKAEGQRIDAFELRCWRRLLRVPWTARRSNQSILQEINPEYSLGGLLLRLNLQYFGRLCEEPTHWKRPWCWEDGRQEKHRGRGWWWDGYDHWLNGRKFEETLGDSGEQGSLTCCSLWGYSQTWFSDWTATAKKGVTPPKAILDGFTEEVIND